MVASTKFCAKMLTVNRNTQWRKAVFGDLRHQDELDGCIVRNAHNTVLSEEALLIYIVPVCYVKTGRYGKPSNIIISLHRKIFFNNYEYSTNY